MPSGIDNCPHCKVSLIGEPIPKDIAHHYSGTHWRREIGIEYEGVYDGVWEWMCPDCKGKWPSEVAKLRQDRTK
jgi:hypothetical protein